MSKMVIVYLVHAYDLSRRKPFVPLPIFFLLINNFIAFFILSLPELRGFPSFITVMHHVCPFITVYVPLWLYNSIIPLSFVMPFVTEIE